MGLSISNFKVPGLLAYTPGTTYGHPDRVGSVGPGFKEWYLEQLQRMETSSFKAGKED